MKFYLTMPNNSVEAMLKKRGHTVARQWSDGFDILLFPGGPDITPYLYGERAMPTTHSDFRRDMLENAAYRNVSKGFPKVGICRGAQLLHVLNGGLLWQDADGHSKQHLIYDEIERKHITVTSTHHQMMRNLAGGMLLAGTNVSKEKKADRHGERYASKRDDKDINDYEVIYHAESNALCFQPHPEYQLKECQDYFFELIDAYVLPPKTVSVG